MQRYRPTRRETDYRSRHEPPRPRKPTSAEFTGFLDARRFGEGIKRTYQTPVPADVHLMPAYDVEDIAAANAMREGRATPQQQLRFLDWVINFGCATYHPGIPADYNPTAISIWAGRKQAGFNVVKLIHTRTPNQSETEHG